MKETIESAEVYYYYYWDGKIIAWLHSNENNPVLQERVLIQEKKATIAENILEQGRENKSGQEECWPLIGQENHL